jgi:hypothetical protein
MHRDDTAAQQQRTAGETRRGTPSCGRLAVQRAKPELKMAMPSDAKVVATS